MKKYKKLKGFTLVELIIVIAIAAILIAVAIPQYNKAKLSAEVSAHNSNVQTIKSAAIMASMEGDFKGNEEALKAKTREYLDGENFPKIPDAIFVHEFGSKPKSSEDINKWEIKEENGNIIVTPGIYKIIKGKVYRESEEPVENDSSSSSDSEKTSK